MLALRASTQLARARCVPDRTQPRPRHARARAEGRPARRRADAPARAVERGAALRQALPRRAQARRHGAQRRAAALQGPVAARRADPAHGRRRRDRLRKRHRGSSCAASCTRSSAGATARAGSSAARCSRPSSIHLVEEVPGVEGVDALEHPRRAAQRRRRAPPARRRRAAVPRPRPHRGEGPRRHQVTHGRPRLSTAASSASPTSSGSRSTRRASCSRTPASATSSCCIARATRTATPCSSSGRRAARWSTRRTEVTIWIARRGYLEHLPAIYRRSDARRPQPRPRPVLRVRAHVRLGRRATSTDGWRFYDPHVAPPEFLALARRTGRRSRSISTGRRRRSARWSSAPSTSIASAARKRGLDAVPQAVHRPRARHRRRTPGRSRASASRARAPKTARASRSTRWCCRRSTSRTASS